MKRRILFLGDLHVGSAVGLWPKEWKTSQGTVLQANSVQENLYHSFQELLEKPQVKTAEAVFLTGDLCQGNNRKSFGRELITADLSEQVRVAASLLRPLCRKKKVYGVIGTGYHDSLDLHLDALVLQELGGECLGKAAYVQIQETGHRFLVTHGARGGSYYTGSRADKTATSLLIGMARGKIPKLDLWVQGHLHHFWYHVTDAVGFLQIPCWQAWYFLEGTISDFGKKQPDIGAVVVDFQKGGLPLVHSFLFPPPQSARLVMI